MEPGALERLLEDHRRWLSSEPGGRRAMLRRAQLEGARLSGAKLQRSSLGYAALCGADLSQADLAGADLRFADLSGCDLRRACLADADLRWAVLAGANLSGANLSRARLKECALDGATINWTDRTLVSELLWRGAGEDLFRRMIAAFIGREETWCWDRFLAIPSVERLWAIEELRRWMKEGDEAPELLRSYGLDGSQPTAADTTFDSHRGKLPRSA